MTFNKILIANRGEISIRIARAASELGLSSVAVFAEDDAQSLHVTSSSESYQLELQGSAAYLDVDAIVKAALATGCGAIHPGYGFLSESFELAQRATSTGLVFIGPRPEHLRLFGDKGRARELAKQCGVAMMDGTTGATTLDETRAFFASLGANAAMMIKALAGGGGRGMRVVRDAGEIDEAFTRCQSEAQAAFGAGDVYVERFMSRARHIEIQVIGDGHDAIHLGERECTVQRRNQKVIETAPSATLSATMRETLCTAALKMAHQVTYTGLGTFEFLVGAEAGSSDYAFIEVNPRLQVEHTITEEVYGVDLVKTQIRIAGGARLTELDLGTTPPPRGAAIEFRINMETLAPDGTTKPTGGIIETFMLPSGPGIRIDTFGYVGYRTSARYDSLLAKLIVHSSEGCADALRRARRALDEFRITGLETNIPLLKAILADEEFASHRIHTTFLEERLAVLQAAIAAQATPAATTATATRDPLAVFDTARATTFAGSATAASIPDGVTVVAAPLQGTVVSIDIHAGDQVRAGQQLAVLESMKMEHVIAAPEAGVIHTVLVGAGDTIYEKAPLLFLAATEGEQVDDNVEATIDLDAIRSDLAETLARHAELMDENRPDAVARRRKTNQRTARENIADLCDPDSFIEYGGLALAAQRQRRSPEDLRRMSPADGLITGIGAVNGSQFDDGQARCAVMAYDYTVFAGTQGVVNHRKKDRLLSLAEKWRMPMVLFAEGGGGRPGDDWPTPAGLETTTFMRLGALNAKVPLVGVVSGRCFAGNAALLGCCDVIIAAADSNIGMGGPAMIEGGGLGVFRPEDVGPIDVQVENGVVDIAVTDEADGVQAAKRYLSYFQGRLADWKCGDQRVLRHAIPENRLRAYDIRTVITTMADTGTVLELRPAFGPGMITALIRIEGRPIGLIANNSRHLGGAIDADGADKAARFIQLCDAFNIPMISLCDTPGMMVGPEVEKTAQVRHVSRLFVNAANASIPFFTIVLRKGYGLGALAMAGGSSHASFFTIAWPSAEFGPMGLEGGVKLAYRKELNAIEDPVARKVWFDEMVAKSYEQNKALSSATYLDIDDVIDPVETRRWIARGLKSVPRERARATPSGARIDTW